MNFELKEYIIEFPSNMEYKIYGDKFAMGIIFSVKDKSYDINHNIEANWTRILMNGKNGEWKDLPFKESTWDLLPDGVIVRKK